MTVHTFARAVFASAFAVALAAQAKPKIDSKPVKATAGKDLTVKATIAADGEVVQPYVAYRTSGSGEYQVVPLKHGSGKEFSGVIPGSALTGDTLQYYVGAYDGADLSEDTWKSKNSPQKVKVGAGKEEKAEKSAKEEKKEEKKEEPEKSAKEEKKSKHHKHDSEESKPAIVEVKPAEKEKSVVVEVKPVEKEKPVVVAAVKPVEMPPPPPEEKPVLPPEEKKPEPVAAKPVVQELPPIQAPEPPKVYAKAVVESPATPTTAPPAGQGYLKIVTDPPGAKVNFDGGDIGLAPLEQNAAEGDYIVQVKLAGYKQASAVVHLAPGAGKMLTVTLRPK